MGEGQPLRQQSRGGVGCLAVERHHGCRDPWPAAQLRAPAIVDRRDLDVVRAPADGFLKAMHSHVSGRPSRNRWRCVQSQMPDRIRRPNVIRTQSDRRRHAMASRGRGALNSTRALFAIKRR